jgi:hypothetical protein
MPCSEFEALLAEAVESALEPSLRGRFQAHAASCARCGLLYTEALDGYNLLARLEEVEPPAGLARNILMATTGFVPSELAAREAAVPWSERARGWFAGLVAPVRQPRFAMSFGMAFFSISLLLNVAGVKIASIRLADLRPSAIAQSLERHYYETSARVTRYYDNLRLVYELQTRIDALRKAAGADEQEDQEQQQQQPQDQNQPPAERDRHNTSRVLGLPSRYDQAHSGVTLASAERGPQGVTSIQDNRSIS